MRAVENLEFPLPAFIKPVAEGTGKGVTPASKIGTTQELREVACDSCSNFGSRYWLKSFCRVANSPWV